MKYKKDGTPVIVGFIADQVPIWESMNYWLPFFHHDTPVMTGGERIARKLNMDCYYVRIIRDKRGHYTADIQLITDDPKSVPEYWITEQYYERSLEAHKGRLHPSSQGRESFHGACQPPILRSCTSRRTAGKRGQRVITNYELRITCYQLRITSYELPIYVNSIKREADLSDLSDSWRSIIFALNFR